MDFSLYFQKQISMGLKVLKFLGYSYFYAKNDWFPLWSNRPMFEFLAYGRVSVLSWSTGGVDVPSCSEV